jgi:hypothetical protein
MLDRPVPPLLEQLVFDGLLVKSPARRLQSMAEILPVLDALLAASRPASELDGFDARSSALVPPTWPLEPDAISLDSALDVTA